jgi:hypothetical protein
MNTENIQKRTVEQELQPNQQPLGTQFRSYELNAAGNYWTLDPFQYSITKFKYNFPDGRTKQPGTVTVNQKDFENDPGLVYRGADFETLLPAYTSVKKSANDFAAQSYHRFQANDGYFNPNESTDNSDLWYYTADAIAMRNEPKVAGAPLNVQEVKHIVFPEAQRGGLDSRNVSKYSWTNTEPKQMNLSWEYENQRTVDNSENCQFFNYNSGYSGKEVPFDEAYKFDSNYVRNIGIAGPYEGSMPFIPRNVQ